VATNPGDSPEPSSLNETRPSDESDLSDQYVDVTQLAARRLAEVADQLVGFINKQPMAAAAIMAGGVGVAAGLWVAGRSRSNSELLGKALEEQAEQVEQVAKQARKGGRRLGKAGDYGDLLPLAMKLLENPIVRGLIIRAVTRSLSKRFR
jgi:hypothetical protein